MKGFLGCYNRLQQKDFTARGISAFELPNKKSKELHLRIEVKQPATQLDNSSAFRIVHRFFLNLLLSLGKRFKFYVNGTDVAGFKNIQA